jgi:hypothetical protein
MRDEHAGALDLDRPGLDRAHRRLAGGRARLHVKAALVRQTARHLNSLSNSGLRKSWTAHGDWSLSSTLVDGPAGVGWPRQSPSNAGSSASRQAQVEPPASCQSRMSVLGRKLLSDPAPQSRHCGRPPKGNGQGRPRSTASDLSLLGDLQGVIDLYAEVSHRRLQLGVSEQQLHGSEVLGAPVDQRRLGTTHRVRAVVRRVESEFFDPAFEDSSVLPSGLSAVSCEYDSGIRSSRLSAPPA